MNQIRAIDSGIIGDDKINCHKAYEIGFISMKSMIGEQFDNVKLKRSNRVLPILTVPSSVKVHNKKVAVDPLLLFQQIYITKKFDNQFQEFLI